MNSSDVECACGVPAVLRQNDQGMFFRCTAECGLVQPTPAHSVVGAIQAWLDAMPLPTMEEALHAYMERAAGALMQAQHAEQLIMLAPVARALTAYLNSQHGRPGDDAPPNASA